MITWEDTAHELRPVKAHGVRQEDDLVTEGLLAKCLVRDRGRGGAVPLSPARGCPGHEVALEVSLALVEAHNLSLRQCPAVTQNYLNNEGDPQLPEPIYVYVCLCYILNFSIQIFKKLNLNDVFQKIGWLKHLHIFTHLWNILNCDIFPEKLWNLSNPPPKVSCSWPRMRRPSPSRTGSRIVVNSFVNLSVPIVIMRNMWTK